MAFHITRFSRTVNVSFLNPRRSLTLLDPYTAKPPPSYPSALEVVDLHAQRRAEDIAIWARGITIQEVLQYKGAVHNIGYIAPDDLMCKGTDNLTNSSGDTSGRPSPQQLQVIRETLANYLPKLFIQSLDYKIFHTNVIFENNIRGTRTVGVLELAKQVAFLRMVGHWKFAHVKFDVLKITTHIEDGSVRVRWRIRGISMWKVVGALWKYRLWNIREALKNLDGWYDGFSTFYVGSDGLIYKHVVDKIMPDEDTSIETPKGPLAPKVALIIGLLPRDTLSLSELCMYTPTKLPQLRKC